jgi:predicted Fe-S protein YdhL (DUF1289 family)
MQDDALVAGCKKRRDEKALWGTLAGLGSCGECRWRREGVCSAESVLRDHAWIAWRTRLERVLGKTPEETFARFMPKDANQVSTVRATMRSLDPEQRKIVTDAIVERLGRATPGKQDAAGDSFAPETFLTNWNKLSPGAKQQIFSDPAVRKNMDALAEVTQNLREGAKVFANPSGTAGAAAPMGLGYLGARGAMSLMTGDVAGAAYHLGTAGMLMGGAQIGARMLTSPKVVEWLAQYPKVAPEAASVHLARLGVIYNETKDEKLKEELGNFIQSVK